MEEKQRKMEAEMSRKIKELEAKMKQMSTGNTAATGEATPLQPGTKPQISQPPSTSEPQPLTRESSVTSRIRELEAKMKQTETPATLQPTHKSQPTQQPEVIYILLCSFTFTLAHCPVMKANR